MKKSLFKRIIGFGLACIAAISMAACGGNGNKVDSKKDDPTKTTLNVFTYGAGYGDEWFTRLANAFEKAFANVSFEDGKTGGLVNHTPDMTPRRFRNRNSIFSSSKTNIIISTSTFWKISPI